MRTSSQIHRTGVALLGLLLASGARLVAQAPDAPARSVRLTVTSDRTSPQPLGTTVWFEAAASGGEAPYEYRWAIWNGRDWALTPWTTRNTLAWMPVTANGGYEVQAQVRTSTSASGNAEARATVVYAIHPVVSRVRVRADRPSPQPPGTPVTFVAEADRSAGPLEYRWMLWDGQQYRPLTGYGAAERFTWTPEGAGGTYEVQVRVRRAGTDPGDESVAGVRFAVGPAPAEASATSR